jgi:hypothetical protein
MGKHTSKEFLCGRKHSRVFECREILSKTGSKTGPKTGPDQHPKSRKHRYTGKYSNGRTPKTRSRIEVKNDSKMMVKSTCKIAFGTTGTRSHFSKAGLRQTAFGGRFSRILKKGGQFPKNPMKQAISGAITNRKGQCQNGPKKPPKSRARSGQIFYQTTSRGRGTCKEERLNIVQFLK